MKMPKWLVKFWKTRAVNARPAFDLEALNARVRGLALDDPLWPQLRALLRANVWTELDALASPGLDDAETHRLRGRVGMLMDFEKELEEVWDTAHRVKVEE